MRIASILPVLVVGTIVSRLSEAPSRLSLPFRLFRVLMLFGLRLWPFGTTRAADLPPLCTEQPARPGTQLLPRRQKTRSSAASAPLFHAPLRPQTT